eukprot:COSAG02_NODE_395_length_23127_cov_130.205663_4_plen_869_part_00
MPELEPEPERGVEWAPSPWSSDPYSDAIAALKAGRGLDRRATQGEKDLALDAVRAYEHGIRLLAAAEAAGVCRTQALHALRPKMVEIDRRIALLSEQLDATELRAAVDADAASYQRRCFTVTLDLDNGRADLRQVTFTAADVASFDAELRAHSGAGPADRFELYDEDLEEWFVPGALSDVPDQMCRARISQCKTPVAASPGSARGSDSTEQVIARQRDQIAQLRRRLESLSSTAPSSPRSKRQGRSVPEGVPPPSTAAAQAVQKSREAAHGQIARSFYEFDADGSGYLDESEVGEFCNKLGLLLSPKEVTQALAEMEMDDTRDGKIEFDEFLNWWEADSTTKAAGSLAFRLQEAKEKAFAAELAAGTPMGQLLAHKQAAAAAAGEADASIGSEALAAQDRTKKGLHQAQSLSPAGKAMFMSHDSMAMSVASTRDYDDESPAAPAAAGREQALASVHRKRAALLDQTENPDEARAKLQLVQSVDDWLTEVGIGGNQAGGGANRGFDPTALVEFAWEHMLEDLSPDELYRRYVEAQQLQAQQALWLQLMQGTELHNLSTMSALDVEQFALKSGPLEHETSKNKWDKMHAILWRDPAVDVDDTRELGLLLYGDEDAAGPSMVVQLFVGKFSVTPPKTKRQNHSFVFRLQAGDLKLILGAATLEERQDWTDCLLLTESVRQRLRTSVSREETILAEQQRLNAVESSRRKLSARMSEGGPTKILKSTAAQELSSCRPTKQGWVRREGFQNVFTRTWCVLWQDNGYNHATVKTEAQVESVTSAWLLFFESPSSSKPTDLYALTPANLSTSSKGGTTQAMVVIGNTKNPRSNCEHCLRVDGRPQKGSGGSKWKVVFGTDDADDLSQWRTLLEQAL